MGETEDMKGQAKVDRRKQIMDAALVVFSKKGYGEATIPDIAVEAGIAVGTIYHYYDSKRDLLESLIQTYVITEPLVDFFVQLAKGNERISVEEIIEKVLNWGGADDLNRFVFVFTEVIRDPQLRERFAGQFLTPVLQALEKYVADRVSSGEFRRLDPQVAAWALAGMISGFVLLRQVEGERSPTNVKPLPELTADLAGIILEGFQNRGS